jgi:hypothetical protein
MKAPVTAIILAGGEAKRYGGKIIKALLEIDGAPLISRTLRQLKERGVPAYVMLRDPVPLREAGIEAHYIVSAKDRTQTEAVYLSQDYWGKERTLFLFGDAYYSDACLDLALKGKYIYYCGTAEIWVMSVPASRYCDLRRVAKRTVALWEKRKKASENLWRLYRTWQRIPYIGPWKKSPGLAFEKKGSTACVFDETIDFDEPDQYERWKKGYRGELVRKPGRAIPCQGMAFVEFIGKSARWRCPYTNKVYQGFHLCRYGQCPEYRPQWEVDSDGNVLYAREEEAHDGAPLAVHSNSGDGDLHKDGSSA